MTQITFLKLLVIYVYASGTNNIPWPIWLWAIIEEIDYYIYWIGAARIIQHQNLQISLKEHEKEINEALIDN